MDVWKADITTVQQARQALEGAFPKVLQHHVLSMRPDDPGTVPGTVLFPGVPVSARGADRFRCEPPLSSAAQNLQRRPPRLRHTVAATICPAVKGPPHLFTHSTAARRHARWRLARFRAADAETAAQPQEKEPRRSKRRRLILFPGGTTHAARARRPATACVHQHQDGPTTPGPLRR